MAKQLYVSKTFRDETASLIDKVNVIVEEYQAQGFVLTVRQIYYQLVARGFIPNTLPEYKRVAGVINDGKLAGMIDWDAIEDRTREFVRNSRWGSAKDILDAAARSFHMDLWEGQEKRPFVVIEKEALVGVLEGVCREFDIPLLAARGYPSGSVLREFAVTDVRKALRDGQVPVILHLGDHDPSGIDMTRDLTDRICLFAREGVALNRLALNMDQIEDQRPPENPAKVTDSRFIAYKRLYGESSWELDALSPNFLDGLIRANVEPLIDREVWDARKEQITTIKERITEVAENFEE